MTAHSEIDIAEIRMRAERRLGELIRDQKETMGLAKGGQPYQSTGSAREPVEHAPTLAEIGIDKKKLRKRRCDAKCRRTGKACRQWGMRNGRCRLHGGLSTGPPKGSRNAWKHGIYSRYMTAKDKQWLAAMTYGGLTEEIVVLKVQLARAVEAQAKADETADPVASLDVESVAAGTGPTGETRQVVRRRRDYDRIISRLAQRIKDLTLAQELLLKEGAAGVPVAVKMEVSFIRPGCARAAK